VEEAGEAGVRGAAEVVAGEDLAALAEDRLAAEERAEAGENLSGRLGRGMPAQSLSQKSGEWRKNSQSLSKN
jgi:hypothetical protein